MRNGYNMKVTLNSIYVLYLQNPQVDIQAMARCHRIGQTRPVVIYKLCTKGTIDEVIIKRAEAKRLLEKMVMSKELRKLDIHSKDTLMELKQLLESKESTIVTSTLEGNFLYFLCTLNIV